MARPANLTHLVHMDPHRSLSRVITLPAPSRGQFGPDHSAIEVITPEDWRYNDPFILLMDDRLDGTAQAGPHPHAGFETVTYVVEGRLGSESGSGELAPGDVEWTTAGSGIVHGPETPLVGKMRVLQLWLTLPRAERWTAPDHQIIRAREALVREEPGARVRLYSGATGTLRSTTRNRVPVTLVHLQLDPGAALLQTVPRQHNGFVYVLEGSALISSRHEVTTGQIGWLDPRGADVDSSLSFENRGDTPLELLLYTGERQNVSIVSYGPFIGDTREDIVRSFERYQTGTFRRY